VNEREIRRRADAAARLYRERKAVNNDTSLSLCIVTAIREALVAERVSYVTHTIGCPALIGELGPDGYGTGRTLLAPSACTCKPDWADEEAPDCRVCGGDGFTDGSAEMRADRGDPNPHDTTCVACGGSGKGMT